MPRTITPLVADVVRPRGSIHHEIWSGVAAPAFEPGVHGIRGEKFLDQLLRFRREMFFRDERDGLVALAAPRASARRRTKTGKQGAGTQEEFPAHLLEPHAERCILRKVARASAAQPAPDRLPRDRKSTRLNSSHGYISYAVFCLKKKKGEAMPFPWRWAPEAAINSRCSACRPSRCRVHASTSSCHADSSPSHAPSLGDDDSRQSR